MKLTKIEQVNEFLSIVDSCKGEVTLRSIDGDIFNLKSKLSQYIAIAALLGEHGDELASHSCLHVFRYETHDLADMSSVGRKTTSTNQK